MPVYNEEDYLQLRGAQHFAFCRRRWALIHIEGQWAENARTVGGAILHERAHDAGLSEKRGNLVTVRGLRVFSATLGISGECDVVEFRRGADGVRLRDYDGLWLPTPVEYKSGTAAAAGEADKLQLCLEAMCLEEMLGSCMRKESGIVGARLYDGEKRIAIDAALRDAACAAVGEMHAYMRRGYTPRVRTGRFCRACSLKDICLPALCKERDVAAYIREAVGEGDA